MANPTPTAVRDALRTILRTVTSIGIVAETIAQDPPWLALPDVPAQAFWTVRFAAEGRAPYAAPRYLERRATFALDGWLPLDEDTNTEERLDNLALAVLAALQDERTLNGTVDDCDSPQCTLYDPGPYRDRAGAKECHHAQIMLTVVCDLTYAAP